MSLALVVTKFLDTVKSLGTPIDSTRELRGTMLQFVANEVACASGCLPTPRVVADIRGGIIRCHTCGHGTRDRRGIKRATKHR